MRLMEVIKQLEWLIDERKDLIKIVGGKDVFVKDCEALKEAVQALSMIRDNRTVIFCFGEFGVGYEKYNGETAHNEGGIIFKDTGTSEEDSLKMQNDQLKATVCELMDSMRRLFDDRDRLNHLVKEREQDIEKLEKKLKELSDDSKYCKTCKYYDAPHCTGVPSYDPRMVSPTYTCKDWQPKESV